MSQRAIGEQIARIGLLAEFVTENNSRALRFDTRHLNIGYRGTELQKWVLQ